MKPHPDCLRTAPEGVANSRCSCTAESKAPFGPCPKLFPILQPAYNGRPCTPGLRPAAQSEVQEMNAKTYTAVRLALAILSGLWTGSVLARGEGANYAYDDGSRLLQSGDDWGAISRFDEAIARNPRHSAAYNNRGI